jgi:HD-like signal output (HDOD) protein
VSPGNGSGVAGPEALVQGTVTLCSPPQIFARVSEVIHNPRSSVADIARIISEDQGLTTRILKLANSPLYAFPARIATASHAVTVLGTQQISDLVLASSLIRLFKGISKELIDMDSFWCHSISCGLVARTIATYRREPNVERFFAAGIIHDIGRLIMYTKMPEESRELLEKGQRATRPLYEEERGRFGFDHAAVGGALLKAWKLPRSLEEMVSFHHTPSQAKQFPVDVAVVHVADVVTHAMQLGSSGEQCVPPLAPLAWDRLEVSATILTGLISRVDEQYAETVRTFQDVDG